MPKLSSQHVRETASPNILERPCEGQEGGSMLLRREGGFLRREGGFLRREGGFLRRGGGS